MASRQHAHVESVMRALEAPGDDLIRASWQRCALDHRLDPARDRDTVILSQPLIRAQQEEMGEDLAIAREAVRALFEQVAPMGYVVLLTNARGVTVDFLGELDIGGKLRRAGLWLGADWNESIAGTNGVGTCIATHRSLTVHQDEHFDVANISLSCTTAPVFDSKGELQAVIDVSALQSPGPRESQRAVAELVRACAADLEAALFRAHHRADWIVRLGSAAHFLDVRPQMQLAVDPSGTIVGCDHAAARFFGAGEPTNVIGRDATAFFATDLERFVGAPFALDDRLFVRSVPPSTRRPARTAVPAPLARLSGGDAALDTQLARAARLVESPIPLLVTGETGTGKEWLARAIHASSSRSAHPFVAVNCAAIPESLFESELFGHLAGSFSGANARGTLGLVRAADRGTLLLDEIGELSLSSQAALLRVLSEREVLPVGATRPIPVDVRLIAATHRDLETLVREGRFREDLFYRIDGAHLTLPPLRERTDLPWLLDSILRSVNAADRLTEEARRALLAHAWPGNLRELHNALTFAASIAEGPITVADLPDRVRTIAVRTAPPENEAEALVHQLRAAGWNVASAARTMGIARMTLYRRMKRLGISSPNQQDAE